VPWFKDFLHPSMELFFRPSLDNHGSYFLGWTTAQEAQWKQNYRIWMDALRHFGIKGGLITTGDDAGYIYSLYGFGMVRELELHEEAGFHPLEVIQHATANGAKMVGLGDRLGRVRAGYIADLLVVNGNPLQNLRVLNPYGVDVVTYDGKPVDNYSSLVAGDPKIRGRARRRHRVDDSRRHPVSRAHDGGRDQGHRLEGPPEVPQSAHDGSPVAPASPTSLPARALHRAPASGPSPGRFHHHDRLVVERHGIGREAPHLAPPGVDELLGAVGVHPASSAITRSSPKSSPSGLRHS
jgi:hypothetical protein